MKNLGGENIDVKKIKQRIGTVLKSLLVLGVVLSGVFGAYAETEGQQDSGHPLKKAEMCRCFCGFYWKSTVYGKKCKLFLIKRKKYLAFWKNILYTN